LVGEGVLTPSQPSFSAAITSPPAPPRGAYGLLLFVLSIDLGVADLTVTQISSPVYRGAVTYIRTLLDTGDIARVYPEVPPERYAELSCVVAAHLKCYEHPLAASGHAGAPPSPGPSLWASDLAGATRVDRQWAFNGTTCARLGPGKISVLFWIDNLLSALRGEYSIHDGKQQGLILRQLVEGNVLQQLSRKIDELPDLRRLRDSESAPPRTAWNREMKRD
jgi:hypothetical protein